MGACFERIDEKLAAFIGQQHVFFVGTAPTSLDGLLNVSPKGLDTFRILGERTVAYLDLTGSGIETVAHLRENGRLTIMFCAFEGSPRILRLHGRGRVVEPADTEFPALLGRFPEYAGVRSVIVMEIDRIADSCGWAVPRYEFVGERSQLEDYARKKGPETLDQYRRAKNAKSLNGLNGLRYAANPES
jgi:hypothetical protein